jgi:hypothetical protein
MHRGNSRGSQTRTPQPADTSTSPARPDRPRRRPDPQLLHHRRPADPRPLPPAAPPHVHSPGPPPARGPALPHRHGHRPVTFAQEPPGLPRAPLRHRRVGRAHVPELLGLCPAQLPSLNDDRVGRCLDRLFDVDIPALALAVVVHAVREFAVDLDELHNDSTTITFHGDYETADRERTLRGQLRLAVTWGHNKDHRPDLKQLLYILTVTRDGAVPVQFRVQSGNATDDRSHRATRDLLCKLTGRRDILYVADCKPATAENMAYIHRHGGRFLGVLPRTRGEDAAFRAEILSGRVQWRRIHD